MTVHLEFEGPNDEAIIRALRFLLKRLLRDFRVKCTICSPVTPDN